MTIIGDFKDTSKGSGEPDAAPINRESELESADTPPPYIGSPTNQGEPSSASSNQPSSSATVSNYISVRRWNGSIKGSWILNPALHIPDSLLPECHTKDGKRRHFDLRGWNGGIEADITIPNIDYKEGSVSISCKTVNGTVKLTMHRPYNHIPLNIQCKTNNGDVVVFLPRNFTGPIDASTWNGLNGSLTPTPTIKQHQTTISEGSRALKCFIGDKESTDRYLEQEGRWDGDTLTLFSSNGSVRIAYENETYEKGWQKFWKQILG